MFRVLLTDYAWPDLEIERRELAAGDAELIVAEEGQDGLELARDVDAIMTNWKRVSGEMIRAAERCRIISRLGIGLDNIDVAAATERGIPVTNVPDYCLTEVAEHTLALILALARNVGVYHQQTKQGEYQLRAGVTMRRVAGQTLGLVGLGNIGGEVARKAQALGLRVLGTNRSGRDPGPGIELTSLDELLQQSDFVSLHAPLTDETQGLIGRRELSLMRPTAFLINTARGKLVDHAALADALAANRLAGAGLDVQDPEPPDLSKAPYNDPRVIVTPHAAFVSEESLFDLRTRACRQVVARLRGEIPPHVVNPQVL